MGVGDSYISRLVILTLGGYGFLLLGVCLLRLGVSNSYVWEFVFLRLAVKDSYVCGIGILTFGGLGLLRLGVSFLPFGG